MNPTTRTTVFFTGPLTSPSPHRVHGHALLQKLSVRPDFLKLWTHMVPERDRRPIEKLLKKDSRSGPR